MLTLHGPPLREGAVLVDGDRVVRVGVPRELEAAAPVRDLGSGVLLPGLVNAHCHLELSHLRGRVDTRAGFVPWVESLVAAREAETPGEAVVAAAEAVAQLEAAGTAGVGDVSNRLEHLGSLEDSDLSAVVFHELIGWDPSVAAAVLASAEERVQAVAARPTRSRLDLRLAAHAPHSVSPALLKGLAERGGPAALHLAESPEESRFLESGDGPWEAFLRSRGLSAVPFGAPRASPVRYAESLGALHSSLVAAHCVQVDEADLSVLARRGVRVALCPRSNATLGVGLPPLPRMIRAGVRLALGTDSLASVPSLDLLADAAVLHRAFPEVPAEALVRMATVGGAEALGLPDLGRLVPGARAALAFAPCDRVPRDPYAFLVSGDAQTRRVSEEAA